MRIAVDHRTIYRFTEPQARVVQLLRLTPADTDQQTIADWRILVGCDARLRPARDGFGNVATMLYAEGPLDHIEIAVTGEVLTVPGLGVVTGAVEPFPPLFYTRLTALAEADAAVADFARGAAAGQTVLDRLHALNRAIHSRFPLDAGRPIGGRTARETFNSGQATARDLAHLFIASTRALGLPARYISGYSLIAARGETRPTPHAWAEAWIETLGWVGFDPSLGLCAAEEYVRVAIGLDAAGATPVTGSRLGDGAERLEVGVTVDAVSEA